MSSSDHSQQSASGLQLPGLVHQLSPAEQLPFPESGPLFSQPMPYQALNRTSGPATPAPGTYSSETAQNPTQQLPGVNSPAGITRQLVFNTSPLVTRQLPDMQTGALSSVSPTTSLRQPIVIPATGKKSRGTLRPPNRGRRTWVTGSMALVALVVVTLLTSFIVLPLATGGRLGFSLTSIGNRIYQNADPNSNASLLAQAATETAIKHQDGYDQTGYNNGGTLYTGSGVTADRFSFGQCTYYADLEYHALTGHWVDWIGNAYQWSYGASAAGWVVSATPHVYSIIVLQPYVEGAGGYGHVAVVERINSDGSVYTANMNWYANGGWDRVSYWTFTPGRGVLFVWHP
jgi:surface antigen